MQKMFSDKKAVIFFLLPGIVLFTVILFIPICYCVYISLCEWNVLTVPKFIGLNNYIMLFTKDSIFITAIKNSIFFMIFSVVSQLIVGLAYAAILTNMKRGRNFFKNVIYLPCVLSSAALGLLFCFLLKPTIGLNQLLSLLGIQGPLWLTEYKGFIPLPMWVIAFIALWQYVGQSMMLYMAQIASINGSLYEACYVDGGNRLQAFSHITLPLVKPMIATCVSLNCIGSLKFFDLVYNMTQGGPNHVTENIATWLYYQGFHFFKYGYGSSIAVVLLLMCLLVTLIVNKALKTENYEM